VKRARFLALALGSAISFAFVVGVVGLHRWFGVARVAITIALTIWIVLADWSRRQWLPGVPRKQRGLLRLGAAALLAVETGRVAAVIAKHGFVTGDAIAILIDLIVFGYLSQGALVELGMAPGNMLFDAALRARAHQPEKALRLAARTTKLYRKWDEAWLLRAGIVGEQQGQAEQVVVLRKGLRYCPRSKEIRDALISGLYANGGADEAAVLLEEYRDMFPRSGRPALIDAANALTVGDFAVARAHLAEARERAQKEDDTEALAKIARVISLMPGGIDADPGTPSD
jgi:hypothetical protein